MNRTRLRSLNDAIEGIIYATRNQKNLRIHFFLALVTLLLAAVLDISRIEFLVVTLAVGFVVVSELINSAVEGSVDLITGHYHPMAKVVKDMAAGAVLISSVIALICGYLVFFPKLTALIDSGVTIVKRAPAYVTLMILIFVLIMVVAAKARFGKGTPLSGGMPSGHSALSFSIFTAIALITENALVIVLTFIMATMVSHSRLIYRIHTLREVVLGAFLGSLSTLFLFQVFT
jgi:diacylglycerol kinase (ATP)